jgi:hypothetical protein
MARRRGHDAQSLGQELNAQTERIGRGISGTPDEPYVSEYPGASPATIRGSLRGTSLIDSPKIASPQFAMQPTAGGSGPIDPMTGQANIGYAAGGSIRPNKAGTRNYAKGGSVKR